MATGTVVGGDTPQEGSVPAPTVVTPGTDVSKPTKRAYLLDVNVAKGLAIFLVVYGHLVTGTPPAGNAWYMLSRAAIYAFHMPFFIYLSGYMLLHAYPDIGFDSGKGSFLLRRAERMGASSTRAAPSNIVSFDKLSIDPDRREVRLDNKVLALTAKEFDLLLFFAQNPGRVYSRSQLLSAVWRTTLESYEHNVNTNINRLRAKIEADPADPTLILTEAGIGYRFHGDQL